MADDLSKQLDQRVHDSRRLRTALGRFPTGVTVVTARNGDAKPVGVTVNSFSSVSLDPPLILWSLQRDSKFLRVFTEAEDFAINILAADQADLSQHFAGPGGSYFDGLDWRWSVYRVPLLANCAARFECRRAALYEGGDHQIFLGHIARFDCWERAPLIFYDGEYHTGAPVPQGK